MTKKKPNGALVLGIGNVLMRDEGAGVRAVELFESTHEPHPLVRCVDGGTAGIALIEVFRGFKYVIIVDTVNATAPAGTILSIAGDSIKRGTLKTAAHGIGVNDLIELARLEDVSPEVSVIGIVPHNISPGLTLTPIVKKSLDKVMEEIRAALKRVGIDVKPSGAARIKKVKQVKKDA